MLMLLWSMFVVRLLRAKNFQLTIRLVLSCVD